MRSRARALCALAALAVAGCGDAAPATPADDGPPLPWARARVPDPPAPEDNPTTADKADLGRLLFYDPLLSSDRAVACATCHSELWGMSDGLAVSIGVGGEGPTGPGREGPTHARRNAQTLWNAAFRGALFHDGRAASLEEQALAPLREPKELGREPADVVADLAAIPGYVARFRVAFPEAPGVTVEGMTRALAAFERTLVSDRAPYDQYVAGDEGALAAPARRGMALFAEVGCSDCHAPPLFESARYVDRGAPAVPDVDDRGREEVTHDAADRGAFRVPTLRNLRETGPYFHSGAVDTLEAAVRHEVALGPRALSDAEVADLVAFLVKGLIDPSRSPARPREVPSGLPVPTDGFRIPR